MEGTFFPSCESSSMQRLRGNTKQKMLAMILHPSMRSSISSSPSKITEIIYEARTLQLRCRKLSDQFSSMSCSRRKTSSLSLRESNLSLRDGQLIQINIIQMDLYGEYYDTMNINYMSVQFWPQPYPYTVWYQQQTEELQSMSMHPAQYSIFYEYGINRYAREMTATQPHKPSRSQKRRLKKKQMQDELQKEKEAIGDWVRLERKDLIEGIEKIEEKERKTKQKKKQKLSHLIEIHKEVYKHYCKRDSSTEPKNRRVKTENKKKRLSYIKKMKVVYQKQQERLGVKNSEKEWESESDEDEKETTEKVSSIKEDPPEQIIQQIQYNEIGKLTGIAYQNIRLRQWVRNYPNEELEDVALRFVNRIAYKQAINRVKRPEKAKKLVVSGIKQCKRTLRTIIDKKKARILIVALNIERNPLQKGVDDEVQNILGLAQQIKIPVIHISTRPRLGRAFTGKFGPRVTMVSIINFQGYQDMAEELLAKWKLSCEHYNSL